VPYRQGRPEILYNYSETLLESGIGLHLALRFFEDLRKTERVDLLRMCKTGSEHQIIAGGLGRPRIYHTCSWALAEEYIG
jgi:hypothetical protein